MAGLNSLWALEGKWRLEREIVHIDGTVNRLCGEVHFHRAGEQLIQDEAGQLIVGDQTVTATRRYVWVAAEGQLEVFFDDMRPFHTVTLHAERHETVHMCDPDRYAVDYDFSDWPNWRAVWQVKGPRKDYVMTSRYAPL